MLQVPNSTRVRSIVLVWHGTVQAGLPGRPPPRPAHRRTCDMLSSRLALATLPLLLLPLPCSYVHTFVHTTDLRLPAPHPLRTGRTDRRTRRTTRNATCCLSGARTLPLFPFEPHVGWQGSSSLPQSRRSARPLPGSAPERAWLYRRSAGNPSWLTAVDRHAQRLPGRLCTQGANQVEG